MMMNNKIFKYLNELYPNPKTELYYTKDYELLIAVMLSAQTTDKSVNKVTLELFNKYSNLKALKEAEINELIKIVSPLGNYHKKANNIKLIAHKLYNESNEIVPNDREFLESLSGVGHKTVNVVLAILYNEPCIAVDTHVARVSKRLGLVKKNDNILMIENKLEKLISKEKRNLAHHQLLLFGRYYCKARNPKCHNCKLYDICKEEKKKI